MLILSLAAELTEGEIIFLLQTEILFDSKTILSPPDICDVKTFTIYLLQ